MLMPPKKLRLLLVCLAFSTAAPCSSVRLTQGYLAQTTNGDCPSSHPHTTTSGCCGACSINNTVMPFQCGTQCSLSPCDCASDRLALGYLAKDTISGLCPSSHPHAAMDGCCGACSINNTKIYNVPCNWCESHECDCDKIFYSFRILQWIVQCV